MATSMSPSPVNFGNLIAPDIASEQMQLARRQQIVDLLRQQAVAPLAQQTAGGMTVANSPMEGVAKLAAAYLSGKRQKDVDAKSLDLNQQMAQRYAQVLGGGGIGGPAPTDPSSAPIDTNAAAALSQGASSGSVGPTVANAQRMDAMPPAAPNQPPQSVPGMPPQSAPPVQGGAGNNFNMANLLRGGVVEQLGGAPAASAYWEQYKPTDLQRNDTYLGISQDQSRASELAKRVKEGYVPPTNIRGFGIATPQGLQPLPMNAPQGSMPHQEAGGNWSFVPVTGGAQAITSAAAAESVGKATGKAPFDSPISIPMSDGRTLTLSTPEYAEYQKTGQLPARYSGAQPSAPSAPGAVPPAAGITNPGNMRPPGASSGFQSFATPEEGLAALDKNLQGYGKQGINTVTAIISKWAPPSENDTGAYIADVSRRLGVNPAQQLDMNSPLVRQALSTAITLHEHGPSKVFAPPSAAAGSPPVVGMTPPLGTIPNADASQKASADTMKDSYTRLQSVGTTANSSLDALDKMMGLAAKKNALLTVGPLGTNQSAVNPDAAEYEKQRANVIALMAQQLGAGGTDAGRANISESVPDFGKPKAAIADGLGTLRNQIVAQQLKGTLLTPIYQQGDSKKYTTLENQFDRNVSPKMVPLLTMPPGPQRAAVLKQAAGDPAMRERLNWAIENGLLK